ncbi:MAG: hypothetical protein HC777_01790 [Hyphomonadaceae bacterium]|nr:hypothetical protein [Hyphomonadaceae bacterium]
MRGSSCPWVEVRSGDLTDCFVEIYSSAEFLEVESSVVGERGTLTVARPTSERCAALAE